MTKCLLCAMEVRDFSGLYGCVYFDKPSTEKRSDWSESGPKTSDWSNWTLMRGPLALCIDFDLKALTITEILRFGFFLQVRSKFEESISKSSRIVYIVFWMQCTRLQAPLCWHSNFWHRNDMLYYILNK